jgi:hypothetical protein
VSAKCNRRTQKRSRDHARWVGAVLAGDVQRGAVIRRCARKWKPERDVHGAAERRDLDRRHSDIVIRRDHRIELAAHGAHEDRVGGKWPVDPSGFRRRREKLGVLAAESSTVARVWI